MVSGSRAIFITDEDSNFKFGMATLLGKLYKILEFESAILITRSLGSQRSSAVSQTLCTKLSQNYWVKFKKTWWQYPFEPCDLIIFQGHQRSKGRKPKGHKPKPFLCTQYSPNFFSDYDETLWDCALVDSHELNIF